MSCLTPSPAQIVMLRCSATLTHPGPGGRDWGSRVRLSGHAEWATARALVRKGLGSIDNVQTAPPCHFTATPEGLLALAAVTAAPLA